MTAARMGRPEKGVLRVKIAASAAASFTRVVWRWGAEAVSKNRQNQANQGENGKNPCKILRKLWKSGFSH
jgi:hypothetical protein